MSKGKAALVAAFNELVNVLTVAEDNRVDWKSIQDAAEFSYLLTPKQFSNIKTICNEQGWPVVNVRGIHITLASVQHVLSARKKKDRLSNKLVAQILELAYHDLSQVKANKGHAEQALMLNAANRLFLNGQKFHAVAIVAIEEETLTGQIFLAPVTAYHANEAKVRGVLK